MKACENRRMKVENLRGVTQRFKIYLEEIWRVNVKNAGFMMGRTAR
jgi:hypothetical protein